VLLAGAGLVLVVVQGFLVAPAARRWGETRIAAGGAVLMATALPALPFLAGVPFVAAVLVASAGSGLVTATTASLLAAAGPPEELGARMGQGQSAASAARASGPLAAGALFELAMAAPYLLGGGLSLGVAFLVSRHGARTGVGG
jgi:DHA1 family tetracycline resistance protein-like MFS transporter